MICNEHCTTTTLLEPELPWGHNRAMSEATPLFLDTAIFFALSVATVLAVTATSPEIDAYETRVLGYVTLIVEFPLYTVLAFSSETLCRKHLRRNLISFSVIYLGLGVTVAATRLSWFGWDSVCVGYNLKFQAARIILNYSIGAIPLFFELCRAILWLIQLAAKDRIAKREFFTEMSAENPWGQRSKRSWWQTALGFLKRYIYNWTSQEKSIWVVSTFSLMMASSGMGFLIYERHRMQSRAGGSYKESEFSYGQCLAALIWLPVVFEYAYHMICKYTTVLHIWSLENGSPADG